MITLTDNKIQLREAILAPGSEDFIPLAKMISLYRERFDLDFKKTNPNFFSIEKIIEDLKEPNENLRAILAYFNNNVAGFGKYLLNKEKNIIEGDGLYSQLRKFGVGGALVDEMIQYGRENGYNSIETFVAEDAKNIHLKRGFVILNPPYRNNCKMILKLR